MGSKTRNPFGFGKKFAGYARGGFTMIEIIIALGLLAVLALMVSSLLFKAGQHNKQIEGRGDAWDFTQGIGLTLKTKTLPTATPGP